MQRGGCPGGCVLFSSRSRHTRCSCDWSSDVCSSDLSLVSARGGLWLLYQGWLDLINTAMVRQTRFDALHDAATEQQLLDRKSTRLNSSHGYISYAVFCLKKKTILHVSNRATHISVSA